MPSKQTLFPHLFRSRRWIITQLSSNYDALGRPTNSGNAAEEHSRELFPAPPVGMPPPLLLRCLGVWPYLHENGNASSLRLRPVTSARQHNFDSELGTPRSSCSATQKVNTPWRHLAAFHQTPSPAGNQLSVSRLMILLLKGKVVPQSPVGPNTRNRFRAVRKYRRRVQYRIQCLFVL